METFKRGPGWVTNPKETARLHRYWTKGPGAAKIRWGSPGDFYRCRQQLSKYIGPKYLSSTCAEWHHDALGIWPGEHASATETFSEDIGMSLTASIRPVNAPPREFFEDPKFTSASPNVVTKDGRIMGHLATWGTCHVGFSDVCVTPPESKTGYEYFLLGMTECDDGSCVSTGTISMDTGHATPEMSMQQTLAHYDNTGTSVAHVTVGEDEFGIWYSGWVLPSVDEDKRVVLRGAKFSGDWRSVRGNLELVAALAVNVPGFPVPRPSLAASGGVQTALIAANIVKDPQPTLDLGEVVARGIEEYERRKHETQLAQSLRASVVDLEKEIEQERAPVMQYANDLLAEMQEDLLKDI